jgi:chromosomal replication initiator protein
MDKDIALPVWSRILENIRAEVSHTGFVTWFWCIEPEFGDDGSLILYVPSEFHKTILEMKYYQTLKKAMASVCPNVDMFYISVKITNREVNIIHPRKTFTNKFISRLNPDFTFDSLIVGKCNSAAVSAVREILDNPSSKHNPIYIYGRVGAGKTHLLQAIANHIITSGINAKVLYLQTVEFTDDMIQSMKEERYFEFAGSFEGFDILILDDFQFSEHQEMIQREICRALRELINKGLHIIVASAVSPEKAAAMNDRFDALMRQGRPVRLRCPEAIVKSMILRLHADRKGISFPKDVIELLSKEYPFEIRELIGFSNKIIAASRFSGQEICASSVKQMLHRRA